MAEEFKQDEVVAANLKCQNFPPKKSGKGSNFQKGSPSNAKKKLNQMKLKDYPKDFLDTKVRVHFHAHPTDLGYGQSEQTPPCRPANHTSQCQHFKRCSGG
ncbi:hypothetical protein VP01_118g9 [Puccinia sorghi]|uniref:Uncharacterized protein n=1 Tax=Puccinia sorghi TaxID=27349 RepID=A0A0L6VSC4_9BASI|nr:hypothetical protein VP01_118g9 [Puccinia sorghi]